MLLIIFIAICLRIIGVGYGLPNLFVQDEYHEVMRALELANGNFNFDRTGKGGLYIVLFLLYGSYFVALHLFTGISKEEFAIQIVSDPTGIYLIGRLCSISISVMTLFIAYRFSNRFISREFSYIPIILIAINSLDVELSREIRVDVLLCFFSVLSLYLICDLYYHPSRQNFIKCGAVIGLATTTKITGILLFAPLVSVVFALGGYLTIFRNGLKEYRNSFLLGVAAFLIILSITNPGIWKNLPGYIDFAPKLMETQVNTDSNYSTFAAPIEGHFEYYVDVIKQKFGSVVIAFAMAGGLVGIYKRNLAILNILFYIVVVFFVVSKTGSQTMYYPRYLLPLVAPLALLVGYFIATVADSIRNTYSKRYFKIIVNSAFLLFLAYQSLQIFNQSIILTRPDTRETAAEWIGRNIDADSVIAIEGTKITAARNAVPLRESKSGIKERIEHYEVVEPKQARYLRYLSEAHDRDDAKRRFNLVLYEINDVPQLDSLRSQNVRYIVVDPVRLTDHRSVDEKGTKLLSSLLDPRNARLIYNIDARETVEPGPSVYIFELIQK